MRFILSNNNNVEEVKKILNIGIDPIRSSFGVSRIDEIKNEAVKQMMGVLELQMIDFSCRL